MPGLFTTGFKESGVDIGDISKGLVEKSYLMDVYPGLIPTFAAPGLWLWGSSNSTGQLGDNTNVSKSSPVQTIATSANWKQVACGADFSSAIKTDGTLWLWGNGLDGQLGNNGRVLRSSPIQTIAAGTNWKQVSAGTTHVAAVKTDGTLWLWGFNLSGQLGDNTTASKSSPVQTVAGGTNWKQVSTSSSHTAAVKTDGTLWGWGLNNQGHLGDNSTVNKSSPVQTVAGGNNWKQVACGGHTAAIKTDGTLWLWGSNGNGNLGDNTVVDKSSPVQTVAGGTNWKQVSVGASSTAAIKTDGTLWVWGNNSTGQLGDGTIVPKSSPVQTVAGGNNWKQVSCGLNSSFTGAIKIDGTLWLWGTNSGSAGQGILGDGTIVPKSSPVQTVAGGNNWKQVSCGGHAAAIREFGDW